MEQLTTINILLITLAATTQCFSYITEEGTTQTESKDDYVAIKHENHRGKRSGNTNLNSRQNCNTWSLWVNRHHPTDSDPNDKEYVSKQEMEAFCPSDHGGKVTEIECKDEKGEPSHGNYTSAGHVHFISCTNPFLGGECVMLIAEDKHCPDLEMRYYCVCSNVTIVSTTASRNAEKPNTYPTDGFNAGRLFVPWWGLYLLIALILFSICMCTTVCMYKHLQKKLTSSIKQTRVRPITLREI